ncbi:MAG: hypothetical protein KatS3mg028_0183 [Bacteroidia bacterium]|nr:MAG: hypothetical protein KatS3mg028_0183 [Bacteroidia bacterium]
MSQNKTIEEKLAKVCTNIRKLRQSRGYSQEVMAIELDISQRQYARIENGEVSLTLELIYKISEILHANVSEILDIEKAMYFQNINTPKRDGHFVSYNNTPIHQIKELYENLLTEKDRLIAEKEKLIQEKDKRLYLLEKRKGLN